MVYPQLHIAPDSSLSIQLIDTFCDEEDNPIIEFGAVEGTEGMFINLLTAFMNQYAAGYEDGLNDAMDEGDELDWD